MVTTLSTFGRIFCGVCPHGFIEKYITKFGLKKQLPKALANPIIGVFLLFLGWWATYYMYPEFFKTPYATALLFLGVRSVRHCKCRDKKCLKVSSLQGIIAFYRHQACKNPPFYLPLPCQWRFFGRELSYDL